MLTNSRLPRRTRMVPVTTMEEIALLDDEERAEFLAALKQAEERLKAGEFIEYDPETFKARLLDTRPK